MVDYLVPPWDHQAEAIERAKDLAQFALFFEMGTGKTGTAINIARHKYVQNRRVLRTMIFGPPIVVQNWKREFYMHSKVGDKVLCLEGPGKTRISLFQSETRRSVFQIFVTNYESLLMNPLFEAFLEWKPELVIFDESHRLKNTKAKRSKQAARLADLAKYKMLLTGTPILNTPMDLFQQFRVLDGGATFGKSLKFFQAEYFIDMNAGMSKQNYFPNYVLRPGALSHLNAKIKPKSMVVKKIDCLDLPPLLKQQVFVDLSKDQQALYNAMKKDLIAYVGDAACIATLAITKALRLQQIVSGFITLKSEGEENAKNLQIKDNPRARALYDLLEDITPHSKCLVWAVFRENYSTIRRVCDELGVRYVEVHGEVSPAARQKAIDDFNTDPSIRIFMGHPGSAGIGINLVVASYSIFYSRSFSLEHDLQAEARNHRGGSEIHEKVTRIDLVARETIDEAITTALASKIEIGDKILRDIAQKL